MTERWLFVGNEAESWYFPLSSLSSRQQLNERPHFSQVIKPLVVGDRGSRSDALLEEDCSRSKTKSFTGRQPTLVLLIYDEDRELLAVENRQPRIIDHLPHRVFLHKQEETQTPPINVATN